MKVPGYSVAMVKATFFTGFHFEIFSMFSRTLFLSSTDIPSSNSDEGNVTMVMHVTKSPAE